MLSCIRTHMIPRINLDEVQRKKSCINHQASFLTSSWCRATCPVSHYMRSYIKCISNIISDTQTMHDLITTVNLSIMYNNNHLSDYTKNISIDIKQTRWCGNQRPIKKRLITTPFCINYHCHSATYKCTHMHESLREQVSLTRALGASNTPPYRLTRTTTKQPMGV